MNMNLTCKMSKKFHIPKQTPSTGGSSRQSHSRCSVHIYLYKYRQPFKQLALQSLQVVCFPKQSCFARTRYTFFGLYPNDSPAVCVLERIAAMISGVQWMRIKRHNSTKTVEHKNHSLLKNTELDKNSLSLVT